MQGNLGDNVGNEWGRASNLTGIITWILEKMTWISEKTLCESRGGLKMRLEIFLIKIYLYGILRYEGAQVP